MKEETMAALRAAGLDPQDTEVAVVRALDEDFRYGTDVTSVATAAPETVVTGNVVARVPGVVAGLAVALAVADLAATAGYTSGITDAVAVRGDGDRIGPGDAVLRISGPATAVLGTERTMLNFLTHLSGIASSTRAWVDAVAGTGAVIRDTRKTTPGLRLLEKYAVRCGGGANHRFGLDDAILIKDNHVAACGGVGEAVRRARAVAGHMVKLEVEVDSLDQLGEALEAGPDIVMLDNFSLSDLETAVALAAGRVVLEASGGVTLETVTAIARTGVDLISVGALTHSASVLDIGLDVA